MATSTISNTITTPTGTPVPGVMVKATLKPNGGFRISSNSEIASVATTTSNSSGQWSMVLERNADITPEGTWYQIEETIPPLANGEIHQWTIVVGSVNATLEDVLVSPIPSIGTLLTVSSLALRKVDQTVVHLAGSEGITGQKIFQANPVFNDLAIPFTKVAPPSPQPSVTGSRGSNAALASLLTKLATLGLIVDNST